MDGTRAREGLRVTFTTRGDVGGPETFTGHQGMAAAVARLGEAWATTAAHIIDLGEAGDMVVAVVGVNSLAGPGWIWKSRRLGLTGCARWQARDTGRAMSGENIAVVRSFFDAFLAGDPTRAEPLMDAEFEFVPSNASHIPAPVGGLKEFIRRVAEMANQFDQYAAVPEKLIDAGDDQVIVSVRRSAESHGVQVEDRIAQIYTLRAGRIRRIVAFQTLREALEAAGLQE